MKLKKLQVQDAILNAINSGLRFSQFMSVSPSYIAVQYGKVGVTLKDFETALLDNIDDADVFDLISLIPGIESWNQKPKSEILAAKFGGSPTIKTKRFVPKPGVGKFTGILQGKKDRKCKSIRWN